MPGLDADDLSPIEKYGRWSLAELFPREHPRGIGWPSPARHTARAESGQGRLGIDARHDQGSTVVLTAECCTLEDGDATYLIFSRRPQINRGSGYMSRSEAPV
ncbi:MAG: hypothetical protein ACJ72M_17830 [Propionibacteriaceae bacterium]